MQASSGGNNAAGVLAQGLSTSTAVNAVAYGSGDAIDASTETGAEAISATNGTATSGNAMALLARSNGVGASIYGSSGNSEPVLEVIDAVGGSDLFKTYAHYANAPTENFIIAKNTVDRSLYSNLAYGADVQMSGDLYVYGKIFDNCVSFPVTSSVPCSDVTDNPNRSLGAVTRTASGNDVTMYGTRESLPSVEDSQEAHLVNGHAFVRIDPAFAQTMAMDRPYEVTITPYGNSHGLYVTNRTSQGFEVNENMSGRSTLDFNYRIVAAPFGDRSARLAAVQRKAVPQSRATNASIQAAYAQTKAQSAGRSAKTLAIFNHNNGLTRTRHDIAQRPQVAR